jgi:hypothetical protein
MRALLGVFFIVIVVGLGHVIWSNQNYLRMRLIMMSENVWAENTHGRVRT